MRHRYFCRQFLPPFLYCFVHLGTVLSLLLPYKINEKIAGQQLVYGDILLSPRQLKLSRLLKTGGGEQMAKHIALKAKQNNRWPDNKIPFIFSVKFNERQKRAIREAFAVLEDSSCFRFIPRTNQRDFLFIDMRDGCFSFVGRIGGRQLLSLAAGCLHDYIIWHEVMHALGLEHEHQRPDRDKFIRIHWENVEPGKHLNFEKIPPTDVDLYHTYDYHSLMHYDGTAFGKTDQDNGEPMTTMEPLRDGVQLTDNFELTNFDVEKLQILSKCKQKRRKLRPGMEPKLITDPESIERTPTKCTDRSANCKALKEQGFCWEIRYVRLVRIQCPHTCGFCEGETAAGGQSGWQEGTDYADGKDNDQAWDNDGNGMSKTVSNGKDQNNLKNKGGRISLAKIEGAHDQAEMVDYYDKANNGNRLDYVNVIDQEEWHNGNGIVGDIGTTKKKKKKLLLKASDEAGGARQPGVRKVDEHYTEWAFPRMRRW